jgi:PAS domain-containing protein
MMSLILLTVTVLVVVVGLGSQWHITARAAAVDPEPVMASSGPVFLFHGDKLIDTTLDAQQMIAPFSLMPERAAMIHILDPEFPGLAAYLDATEQNPCRIAHRQYETMWIDVDWPLGQLRVAVCGALPADPAGAPVPFATSQQAGELAMLRDVVRHTPQLIWRTDAGGKVTWSNQAHADFWAKRDVKYCDIKAQTLVSEAGASSTCRIAFPAAGNDADQWFDVLSVPQEQSTLHFATDASAAARADQDRQTFVQTMGKTFAELSIGLAIFDKQRRLVTFNPALLDMTRLGFEFLSTRPAIDTVLDRLRETRMLPEPKDYASWRDQFTAVEAAAKNGTYREIWNLPDGQAFRVTGRPHPDGAFAFLFEDITADLSLTRRFRSDIETGQSVLDALSDGIAVFTVAGTLVMYNRAYASLWGMTADPGLEHRAASSEIARWHAYCAPTTDWTDLHHFIHQAGPREPWSDDALLADGRMLRCQAIPITGGMTMVRFTLAPRNLPVLRKLTQSDPAIRALKR